MHFLFDFFFFSDFQMRHFFSLKSLTHVESEQMNKHAESVSLTDDAWCVMYISALNAACKNIEKFFCTIKSIIFGGNGCFLTLLPKCDQHTPWPKATHLMVFNKVHHESRRVHHFYSTWHRDISFIKASKRFIEKLNQIRYIYIYSRHWTYNSYYLSFLLFVIIYMGFIWCVC